MDERSTTTAAAAGVRAAGVVVAAAAAAAAAISRTTAAAAGTINEAVVAATANASNRRCRASEVTATSRKARRGVVGCFPRASTSTTAVPAEATLSDVGTRRSCFPLRPRRSAGCSRHARVAAIGVRASSGGTATATATARHLQRHTIEREARRRAADAARPVSACCHH